MEDNDDESDKDDHDDDESDNDDGESALSLPKLRSSPVKRNVAPAKACVWSPLKGRKSTPAPPGGQPTSSPVKRRREDEPGPLTPARSIQRKNYHKESAVDGNN